MNRYNFQFILSGVCIQKVYIRRLPLAVKKVFHPIICCAVSADLAAIAFGCLSRSGVDPVLGEDLTSMLYIYSFSYAYICI